MSLSILQRPAGASNNRYNQGTGANTLPCAYNSNVASGSTLIVWVLLYSATVTVTSVTDSKGNVWTPDVGPLRNSVGGLDPCFYCWSAPSGSAGANTVTVNVSGGANKEVFLYE